jgi:hypothetical protein
MRRVKLLHSAVININGDPCKFGKGHVVDVSDETLQDNWRLMQEMETATIAPVEVRKIVAKPVKRTTKKTK